MRLCFGYLGGLWRVPVNLNYFVEYTVIPALERLPRILQIFVLFYFGPELLIFGTVFGL